MRFIGLLFVLLSVAITWFLGIKGTGDVPTDFANMRTRLSQILNLPGLAPSSSGTDVHKTMSPTGSGTTSGLPSPSAGLPPGTVLA